MRTIIVPSQLWPAIAHIDPGGRESAGIALARVVRDGPHERLLLYSIKVATADDYRDRSAVDVTLTPAFVAAAAATARREHNALVFFHTHPFSEVASFSQTDDEGEAALAEFAARRVPGEPHAAIVLGKTGHSARILGTNEQCILRVVGHEVNEWPEDRECLDVESSERFDRQIRLFGPTVQARLKSLAIAIVGLGGTGSFVATELAHLGVGTIRLIDPDSLDKSNLHRVIGATAADIGLSKVSVAARTVRGINPAVDVIEDTGSVLEQRTVQVLRSFDAVFCCTDSHGSRHVLNQLAYQYYVPVFDMGVTIATDSKQVTHVFGRAQMLAPGLPCLTCLRTLDPEQVRRDFLSAYERQLDPYVLGGGAVPQPAVVSLNGCVASLSVTMFLAAFAKIPAVSRHQLYDALRGVVRTVASEPAFGCVTCSSEGAFGQGDQWPVPGRTGVDL